MFVATRDPRVPCRTLLDRHGSDHSPLVAIVPGGAVTVP
jgi:hypothetical protein